SKLQQRDIAPIAAYRGLDFLSRVGLVIRLESKKAFVLCAHPGHANDCIFLMCRTCGEVKEILDDRLSEFIEQGAMDEGFTTERRVIEIHGVCKGCQPNRAGPSEGRQ
ncbi:MAG: transcriptional repressor, partial [Pseudomonadota bacterium]